MSKEAMKLALEALECLKRYFDADQFEWGIADEAITALREALADHSIGCQCPACRKTLHASDCAVHNAPAYPVGECDCGAQQEPSEANELLRKLGLDPEQYRTDGGVINHMKVRAAIQHPDEYQAATQPLYQKLTNCVVCGRLNPKEGLCDHGAEQPAPMQSWKLVPVEPTEDMWKAVNKLDDEMAANSYDGKGCSIEQAWDCLLAAAPQPAQQEPVAWLVECGGDSALVRHTKNFPGEFSGNEFNKRPLVFGHTSPPAQRKPLTDEQIEDVFFGMGQYAKVDLKAFARAIEQAHGITGEQK